MFLCHFPSGRPAWVLPSALPFGARTFLPRLRESGRSAHSTVIVAHSAAVRAVSQGSERHRWPHGPRHGPRVSLPSDTHAHSDT